MSSMISLRWSKYSSLWSFGAYTLLTMTDRFLPTSFTTNSTFKFKFVFLGSTYWMLREHFWLPEQWLGTIIISSIIEFHCSIYVTELMFWTGPLAFLVLVSAIFWSRVSSSIWNSLFTQSCSQIKRLWDEGELNSLFYCCYFSVEYWRNWWHFLYVRRKSRLLTASQISGI